ncbi:hypothetical protein [Natrinema thermotolerans]
MIACDRDRCLCQYGLPRNTYQRDGWDWPHGDEGDVAERLSDRLAVLPDGVFLRLTPPEQPTVDDVLKPGSLIHAGYHHEGTIYKVFRVRRREYYGGIPAYTISLGDVDQEAREDGMPKNYQGANIKELVYQDGEIRKLFANNDTVLEVVGYDSIDVDYQATLAAGWSDA